MFGYINVARDELKVKEYNLFKAYYCGLCISQGRLLGRFTRLALTYDFAALAVLLDGLAGRPHIAPVKRCAVNPFLKRPLAGRSEVLSYCAHMSVALTYFKLSDDANDERRIPSKAGAAAFYLPALRVKKAYPEKFEHLESCLRELNSLENSGSAGIDHLADVSGRIMAEVFQPALGFAENTMRALKQTGYELGRWLYVIDALDDLEEDFRKKRFNPFKSRDEALESIQPLWYNLSRAAAAYELLDLNGNKEIMDNIIYTGLRDKTQKVICKLKGVNMNGGLMPEQVREIS